MIYFYQVFTRVRVIVSFSCNSRVLSGPLVKNRVNITSASVNSPLDECGDGSGSTGQDMNLKTCSGSSKSTVFIIFTV